MGKLRKLFQKNFERRSADWSPEKIANRTEIRHKAFKGIEIAASIGNVASGGKIKAVLDMSPVEIDVLVGDENYPDFDQSVGDLLKQPIMRKAMELAQEFIDMIEDEMGIDIPDRLERRAVQRSMDALSDLYDEMAEEAEGRLSDAAGTVLNWFKDLFD